MHPSSVRPEGFHHQHKLRVRFPETDAQGVVYHANFLVFCDAARVEYFRAMTGGGSGAEHDWRRERGYEVVLAHAQLDFRASARFDDELTIWTRIANMGRSSFSFEHRIYNGEDLVCEANTVQVAIERQSRKPTPLPDEFKQRVHAFEAQLAKR
jgi:acyl-CoA thioester hydrolase